MFDALDVIAEQWSAIRVQMEGLIKLTLAVRALSAVRTKLFIRPDMADDRRLWEVGDASKLRHGEVRLAWKRLDLYGLLWTLLANSPDDNESPGGKAFRDHCGNAFGANSTIRMEVGDHHANWSKTTIGAEIFFVPSQAPLWGVDRLKVTPTSG